MAVEELKADLARRVEANARRGPAERAEASSGRRGRRWARPGVQLLARGVAVEASAGGPRRRAWRTEWLRTCELHAEFQKRIFWGLAASKK